MTRVGKEIRSHEWPGYERGYTPVILAGKEVD